MSDVEKKRDKLRDARDKAKVAFDKAQGEFLGYCRENPMQDQKQLTNAEIRDITNRLAEIPAEPDPELEDGKE